MVDEFYENGSSKSVNYFAAIDQSKLLKKELFYESGNLKLIGNYKDNLKHGQWVYYYENGIVSNEDWFIKGMLHGRSSSSYKNGKLRSNGFYQIGERVREWTWFDESGQLIKRIDFSR